MRSTARTLVQPELLRIHSEAYYKPDKTDASRTSDQITYEELQKYWQEFWAPSDKYDAQILKSESTIPEKLPQTESEKAIVASFRALEPYLPAAQPQGKSADNEPYYEDRDSQTGNFLYYFPVWAEDEQCWRCHNTFDVAALAVAGTVAP